MPRQQKTLIDKAIESGIEQIVKRHPKFEGYENVIEGYIDKKELQKHQMELIQYANQHLNITNPDMLADYLLKGLANYVFHGGAMNTRGKEIVLKKSLEEKANKPFGFLSQWRRYGDDYVERAVQFAKRLESYASSGNMGNMPPELLATARNLHGLGWSDIILDEKRQSGLIGKREYYKYKRAIVSAAEKGMEEIEKYSGLKNLAPVIFGIIGFSLLILSDFNITGGIIGIPPSANFGVSLLGIISIIASLVLFLKPAKKR